MAILIDNDMGRPKNCRQCALKFGNPAVGGYNCIPEHQHIKDEDYDSKTRPLWCPLKRCEPRIMIDKDEFVDALDTIEKYTFEGDEFFNVEDVYEELFDLRTFIQAMGR